MKYIGINGKARSGKDTIAKYIVGHYEGVVQYQLAAPLKNALSAMFGIPMETWEDGNWKDKVIDSIGVTPRRLMQTLGTEWRELIHRDLWLILAEQRLSMAKQFGIHTVVITDVRFPHE